MATRDEKPNYPIDYVPPTSGLLSYLPSSWIPFAELTRVSLRGLYLGCIPCLIGLMYVANVAEPPIPRPALIRAAVQMFLWANIHRSAGCAWNDVVDCDLDRQTRRCCLRPVARGAITRVVGTVFTVQLIMLELLVLRGISRECFADVAIIIFLTFIYPFGKRVTHFVQVILGLNFAWTIILAAHMLDVDLWGEAAKVPTLCFFAAIVTMPVFYDTIYASQDTADDVKSGVKGTAVLFRGYMISFLVTLALTVVALLHTTASAIGMAMPYYSLSVYGPFATFVALIVETQKWDAMPAGSHLLYFTAYLSLLAGLCGNYLASH
ncbi:hypothetical protein ATEIFO6365_0007031700 [Aspergillus terreus]|uniref:Uncharacterized protein n=1 Tax=Aspergillus terreus TaxID=33178 RepID=A0A5M3Z4M8_ASPTE|nr:hypothetical protein ATETN484_0009031700 [Aspergillus terreus]GFF17768.1 hypothetical protein ATEIFO6365_0007031700 [Aspergillus terreus]